MDKAIIDRIKHIECFYEQPPPGMVKDEEEKPEDCIPDTEENKAARDFLANAPSKGLWMPLGKEVKVMQCWRCKQYGHRTGDRECPMFESGNSAIEKFRAAYEDPMFSFVENSKKEENAKKMNWLQHLIDMPTTSESSDDDDDGKHTKKKKEKGKHKKHKKEEKAAKKSNKKKKHKKREDESSDSDSDNKSNKHKKKQKKRENESSDSDSDSDSKTSKSRKEKEFSSKNRKRTHEKTVEKSESKYRESHPKKKHKHKSKH